MTQIRFDVTGVGNAIVDVIAPCSEAFLTENRIEKGAMTLIDEARATELYAKMADGKEVSGGSAANTLAGVASLGGRGAYIGKVADDALGTSFTRDLNAAGVDYATAPLSGGPATARCLINVTPDAQRSMSTFLGASVMFDEADIDAEKIRAAEITFMEGYLFDRDAAKAAFVSAAEIARAADRRTALTLSDTFCVDRHRASFRQLVRNHIDILLANEAEIMALYETDDFELALASVRAETRLAAVTRSEKGAVIVCGDETEEVAAKTVDTVVDTTGAGDLFAAGFLLGAARGQSLYESGRMGVIAAAEVISHYGARPETRLEDLVAEG
ncbi:adenosine kinase [Hyphobacterium marinum]|uniref:Adenosine kinase n=1 Tax=Hyphobacterium marinum TaxID=3116574 RepID=A0ABU7LV01_9PROT|nr:adenosine kinase [Hyphobacterium sp. Y6023]MEE2565392.1 adenosine kinase [Hyphobacterium sp. Y6023]